MRPFLGLFRPFTLLAPWSAAFLFGFLALGEVRVTWEILVSALALTGANAAGNVLNQVYDAELDAVSRPRRPLPAGRVTRDNAWLVALLLYGGTVFVASFLSTTFKVTILLILGFTILYSAPPVRLKRFLFLNNLAIATPRGALGILAAYSAISEPPLWMWAAAACFAVYILGANTAKDFPDVAADRRYGVRNFVTVYGESNAQRIMYGIKTVSFGMFGVFGAIGVFRFDAVLAVLILAANLILARRLRRWSSTWVFFYIEYALLMALFVTLQLA